MNRSPLRTRIPRRMQREYLMQRSCQPRTRGCRKSLLRAFPFITMIASSLSPTLLRVKEMHVPANWTARARKFRVADLRKRNGGSIVKPAILQMRRLNREALPRALYYARVPTLRITENHGLTNVVLDFIRLSEYNKRRRLRIELYYFPRTEAST